MGISDQWYGRILSMPGIISIFLLVFLPIFFLFKLSFLRYDFISPVEFIGFGNYASIFSDRLLPVSLKITIIYAFGVTSISLIVSLIVASGLSKIGQKRFSTIYRTMAILPFAVPLVLSGLIWRWLLDPGIGTMNYFLVKATPVSTPINIFGDATLALIGVIMADAWIRIPFMTIFNLAAMDGISQDLYDAARIDGASPLKRFTKITLPLARNGILFGVFITAMFSFRTVDVVWSMTRGGPGRATYHVGVYILDKMLSVMNLGEAAVIGVIVFLIITGFATWILYWMTRGL